jgi:hypothetical protein
LDFLCEEALQGLWSSSCFGSTHFLNYFRTLLYAIRVNCFWNPRNTWSKVSETKKLRQPRLFYLYSVLSVNRLVFSWVGTRLLLFYLYVILYCSSRYFTWLVVLYCILFMTIVCTPFYIGYFIISNLQFGELSFGFLFSHQKYLELARK